MESILLERLVPSLQFHSLVFVIYVVLNWTFKCYIYHTVHCSLLWDTTFLRPMSLATQKLDANPIYYLT